MTESYKRNETDSMQIGEKLAKERSAGGFVCRECGTVLYKSTFKVSHSQFPCFSMAMSNTVVGSPDYSFGLERTALSCKKCKQHVGHLIDKKHVVLSSALQFDSSVKTDRPATPHVKQEIRSHSATPQKSREHDLELMQLLSPKTPSSNAEIHRTLSYSEKPYWGKSQVMSQWRRITNDTYMYTSREKFDAAIRQLALDAHLSARQLRKIMIEDAKVEKEERAAQRAAAEQREAWRESAVAISEQSFILIGIGVVAWKVSGFLTDTIEEFRETGAISLPTFNLLSNLSWLRNRVSL